MKLKVNLFWVAIALVATTLMGVNNSFAAKKSVLGLKSSYIETMKSKSYTADLVKDFGMKTSSKEDQSSTFQKAIDTVSKKGGGKLIVPAGHYYFEGIFMKSNVHILVDKDAIFSPVWGEKTKSAVLFEFTAEDESHENYIENCSIRGLDGEFTVDYSFLKPHNASGMRFAICSLVKNFLIADVTIKDNYTKFCGIIFVPTKTKGADKWAVSRPTNGEIKNCTIKNADSGYGLCQLHGAQTLYFENLWAKGGVTLRLESGAGGEYAGVFDIKALNVHNEYGRAALMMNPHCTHNGTAKVENVSSISSSACTLIHGGFIDRKHKDDPNATIGTYANDCEVVNIHAVYGEEAQVDGKEIWICEPTEGLYEKFHENAHGNLASLQGPSYAAVFDSTNGDYTVTCKNITSEGFESHQNSVLYEHELEERYKKRWDIYKAVPAVIARAEKGITSYKGVSPEAKSADAKKGNNASKKGNNTSRGNGAKKGNKTK